MNCYSEVLRPSGARPLRTCCETPYCRGGQPVHVQILRHEAKNHREREAATPCELRVVQMGAKERQVGRAETVGGGLGLVPVWVEERRGAHLVQAQALLLGEAQLSGGGGVRELFFFSG